MLTAAKLKRQETDTHGYPTAPMTPLDDAPRDLQALIHEVNGAIFVFRGNAELCQQCLDHPEAARRHLEAIVMRCDQLAGQLRKFASENAPPPGFPI